MMQHLGRLSPLSARRLLSSAPTLPVLTPTQRTSLLVAAWRDLEQRSADRPLINDLQAPHLLAALATSDEITAMHNHPLTTRGGVDILAVRTRMLDSWLERPSWPPLRTTRRQTVLLGAGMDSRAYRLGFSRYVHTVFEVDADVDVLRAKHEALTAAGYSPRCRVELVGADVADAAGLERGLLAAGFDPSLPTRWLAEGLLEYLPPPAHAELFRLASRLGGTAGSAIAAQVLEPAFAEHVQSVMASAAPEGAPPAALPYAQLGSVGDTLGALRAAGWENVRSTDHAELRATTGRDTHPGFHLVYADADPLTAD